MIRFLLASSVMWVWGQPIEAVTKGSDTIGQVITCRDRGGYSAPGPGRDCILYGQATNDYDECMRTMAMAKEDFPDWFEGCASVRIEDLKRIKAPR